MDINSQDVTNILRAILIKPESEQPEVVEIKLPVPLNLLNEKSEEATKSFDDDLNDLLNIKSDKGPLFAALCMPLQNYVMVMNPDMFTDDSKYNFGYIGSPLFNNILILETTIDEVQDEASDSTVVTKIQSMKEETARVLCTFFECLKKEEKATKVKDSILNEIKNVGKKKFLENIVNDNVEAGNVVDENNDELKDIE